MRDGIIIQGKCGIRLDDVHRYDFSKAWIIDSVEKSLRRLQVEQLDVLLLHRLQVNQVEINLHNVDALHNGVLDQCQAEYITPQAWCPLAGIAWEALDIDYMREDWYRLLEARNGSEVP